MKLNCDMGEGFGRYSFGEDDKIMEHIHMANIACGFHAGDPAIMEKTVNLAVARGVEIGAHPSYPDLEGFGRRNMALSPEDVRRLVLYQAGALAAFCTAAGGRLSYIKPHGALYNTMMGDDEMLSAVLAATASCGSEMKLMIQATSRWRHHQELAAEYGVGLYLEAFADRAYEEDGSLRNRRHADALLCADQVIGRVEMLCRDGRILAVTGKILEFPVETLCVHGDSPAGVEQIGRIRALLEQDGA